MNILAVDPSETACGWVIIDQDEGKVLAHGVINSTLDDKRAPVKANVFAFSHNTDLLLHRAAFLAQELQEVITAYNVRGICAEIPTGGQNYNAASTFARVQGVLATLAICNKTPISGSTPQSGKISLAGKHNATKTEMVAAGAQYFDEEWQKLPKYYQEATADAVAAYLANIFSVLTWGNQ